ncbi:MAG: RNA polymerase sigma factor [Acidobacteriota bacterium]|nr:RNA polymerase sigma factor [Acidobacteriota bacterium]
MGDFHLSPAELDSFQEMYENYFSWVVRCFRRMGFRPGESEDLAQDTFLRVYRGMKDYKGKAVAGYLETVARRVGYNEIRGRHANKREARLVSLDGLPVEPKPRGKATAMWRPPLSQEDEVLERESLHQRKRLLAEGLDQITQTNREALLLWLAGHKYREIAELLNISLNAVKSRIYAAKKELESLCARTSLDEMPSRPEVEDAVRKESSNGEDDDE